MVKEIPEHFFEYDKRHKYGLIYSKSWSNCFRVWRNKEALKMECYERNRNIRYAIFRDPNLNRFSNVLLNRTRLFFI